MTLSLPAMKQNADADEVLASIVWIASKRNSDGTALTEIIYELHDEPDLLRQMQLPESAVYAGAVRGDAVLVSEAARSIRKATSHESRGAGDAR